jgi:hypothetical protein
MVMQGFDHKMQVSLVGPLIKGLKQHVSIVRVTLSQGLLGQPHILVMVEVWGGVRVGRCVSVWCVMGVLVGGSCWGSWRGWLGVGASDQLAQLLVLGPKVCKR